MHTNIYNSIIIAKKVICNNYLIFYNESSWRSDFSDSDIFEFLVTRKTMYKCTVLLIRSEWSEALVLLNLKVRNVKILWSLLTYFVRPSVRPFVCTL